MGAYESMNQSMNQDFENVVCFIYRFGWVKRKDQKTEKDETTNFKLNQKNTLRIKGAVLSLVKFAGF